MRLRRPKEDQQQDRVYDSEAAAGCYDSRRFADFDELANWVTACLSSGLIDEEWPAFPKYKFKPDSTPGGLVIRQRRLAKRRGVGTTIAHASRTEMAFSKDGFLTWMVCHELAHTVSMRIYGMGIEGHGREYCYAYLKLVGWFIGYKERDMLQKEFDSRGVLYTLPTPPAWMRQRVGGGG